MQDSNAPDSGINQVAPKRRGRPPGAKTKKGRGPAAIAKAKALAAHKVYWSDQFMRDNESKSEFVFQPPTSQSGQTLGWQIFPVDANVRTHPGGKDVAYCIAQVYRTDTGELYHCPSLRFFGGKTLALTRFILIEPMYVDQIIAALRKVAGRPEVIDAYTEIRAAAQEKKVEKQEDDEVDKLMKQLGGRI